MDNASKGKHGEEFVVDYLTRKGYDVKYPSNTKGCDIIASKDGEDLHIEVKTTQNLQGGIPDMHDSEFDISDDGIFIKADYLYIVRLSNTDELKYIDILSKEDVDKFAKDHTIVKRVRTGKLETALKNYDKSKIGRRVFPNDIKWHPTPTPNSAHSNNANTKLSKIFGCY